MLKKMTHDVIVEFEAAELTADLFRQSHDVRHGRQVRGDTQVGLLQWIQGIFYFG
jgi:hypothetical protein